jgi:transcription antitermination factor NusG
MSIREVAVMQVPGPLETVTTMEARGGAGCAIAKSEAEQWYALVVKPRHDKVVSKTLEHKGYQTLVPLYKKRHRCATRFKESELPLFPGYVFCRFNAMTRLPILTTPGVIQVLGAGRVPIPVDEGEITALQTALSLQVQVSPYPFLQAGQRVRIRDGSLAGVEGIVMNFKPYLRIVLSVTLLRRSVMLEIDGNCVSAEGLAA